MRDESSVNDGMPAAAPSPDAPSTGHRILALDGWRGVAILAVLLGHFGGRIAFPELNWLGQAGVELFLVLSGRLMAEILVFRRQPVLPFLLRRGSRIFPALLVFVGFTFLVLAITGQAAEAWRSALAAVALYHNYLPYADTAGPFHHTWSVAVEEHSYLLLAALVLLLRRNRGAVGIACLILIVLAVANGAALAMAPDPGAQYPVFRTDVRAASVLMGFLLFLVARDAPLDRTASAAIVAPGALLAGLTMFALDHDHWVRYGLGTLCLAIAVVSVERSRLLCRILEWPGFVGLGLISYSLYLWQQPIYGVAKAGFLHPAIAVGIAIAIATWSYFRIEKPARSALNHRIGAWVTAKPKLIAVPG